MLKTLPDKKTDLFYFQTWVLVITLIIFGFYVAHDQHYFRQILETDKSYLSVVILLVFMIASAHSAWHIFAISWRIKAALAHLNGGGNLPGAVAPPPQKAATLLGDSADQFVVNFVHETKKHALTQGGESTQDSQYILEIYADQLRAPVEIGWFVVDMLIRLGLIGTIIGFILILQSLVSGPLPDSGEVQKLLISMSSGMGTALYTTLSGLMTATLLGIQYLILGRGVEHLIAALVRIRQKAELD